jgi:exopolyphosphatase/pppGpp-phosphohydrolase
MKIDNIVWEINHDNYPDHCDAFIASCDIDGVPATEEQLEELAADRDRTYKLLMQHLY